MKKTLIYSLGTAVMLAGLGLAQGQDSKPAAPATPAAPAGQRPPPPNRGGGGGGGGGAGGIEQRVKLMNEQLTLSEDQQEKLKKLLSDQAAKTRELRQDTALTPEQRREKTTKLREDNLKQLKDSKILTEDQLKKWEKYQDEVRKRAQDGRQRGGVGGPRGNRNGGGGAAGNPEGNGAGQTK